MLVSLPLGMRDDVSNLFKTTPIPVSVIQIVDLPVVELNCNFPQLTFLVVMNS